MNPRFLMKRLTRMSPAEMLYRVWRFVRQVGERLVYGFYTPRARLWKSPETKIAFTTRTWSKALVLKKADRLCRGTFDILARRNLKIGPHIDYHTDYSTGICARSMRFGPSLDYRDSRTIGDIKYIWELNRHLFLFTLARAHTLTGKKKYVTAFSLYLAAWLDQNPFSRGINWASTLEVSLRLINWILSWLVIAEVLPQSLCSRWRQAIYLHCLFVRHHFSLHSSANNHLLGEATGLFLAASVFRQFKPASRWMKTSFRLLERESRRQTHPDGVNREQSVWYAHYVLDFLLLALAVFHLGPCRFSRAYRRRLIKMSHFLAALRDRNGHIPAWGDEDGGTAFDANQLETGLFTSFDNVTAFLAGNKAALKGDEKTGLLLDFRGKLNALGRTSRRRKPGPPPSVFPQGGYAVLGKDFGKRTEQKLVFDAGPLGFAPLAAHGHADALSFTYSYRGFPLFIDPGTGTYYASDAWRSYFRSTAAHNTLCLDGRDQSEQAGRFMWGKKAQARLLSHVPHCSVRGEHDGYSRLSGRVIHEREIRYHKDNDLWEIQDELKAKGEHRIELFFHLSPQCRARIRGHAIVISFPGGQCTLFPPESMRITLHRGEKNPICGWYSPAFDVCLPTITVKAFKLHTGGCTLMTTFKVRAAGSKGRTARV